MTEKELYRLQDIFNGTSEHNSDGSINPDIIMIRILIDIALSVRAALETE